MVEETESWQIHDALHNQKTNTAHTSVIKVDHGNGKRDEHTVALHNDNCDVSGIPCDVILPKTQDGMIVTAMTETLIQITLSSYDNQSWEVKTA